MPTGSILVISYLSPRRRRVQAAAVLLALGGVAVWLAVVADAGSPPAAVALVAVASAGGVGAAGSAVIRWSLILPPPGRPVTVTDRGLRWRHCGCRVMLPFTQILRAVLVADDGDGTDGMVAFHPYSSVAAYLVRGAPVVAVCRLLPGEDLERIAVGMRYGADGRPPEDGAVS